MLGHKDVDLLLMEQLSDRDLLNLCSTSKMTHTICKNETFWRKRTMEKFNLLTKDDKRTWRNFYLAILKYKDAPGQGILDLSYKWGYVDKKRYLENKNLVDYLRTLVENHIKEQLLNYSNNKGINPPEKIINGAVNKLYISASKSGDLDILDGKIPEHKLSLSLLMSYN